MSSELTDLIRRAKEALDKNNVPMEGRWLSAQGKTLSDLIDNDIIRTLVLENGEQLMNTWQKLRTWLFRTDYILLEMEQEGIVVRPVYKISDKLWVHPGNLPNRRMCLYPGGELGTLQAPYLEDKSMFAHRVPKWHPITAKMRLLYAAGKSDASNQQGK